MSGTALAPGILPILHVAGRNDERRRTAITRGFTGTHGHRDWRKYLLTARADANRIDPPL